MVSSGCIVSNRGLQKLETLLPEAVAIQTKSGKHVECQAAALWPGEIMCQQL